MVDPEAGMAAMSAKFRASAQRFYVDAETVAKSNQALK